jgi:hypothetical protein
MAHDRRSALCSSDMQPHSFSKRQLAAIALMLHEEEKNAALSDKRSVCGFTSVSEAENQKANTGLCTEN